MGIIVYSIIMGYNAGFISSTVVHLSRPTQEGEEVQLGELGRMKDRCRPELMGVWCVFRGGGG